MALTAGIGIFTAGTSPAQAVPPVAAAPQPATPAAQLYRDECGSCHVAYPPRALPGNSWRTLLRSLDRHFGTDASLDSQAAAAIGAWLAQNAGRDRGGGGPPVLRITEAPWFRHEHAEIGRDVWTRPAVRSAANCGACHAGAAAGRFGEHDVRIPR